MRRPVGLLTSACVLAFTAGAISVPIFAQTDNAPSKNDKATTGTIETVVVTATKGKAEALQKVPMAVQVFGAEQLKDQHIESIADLASSIPGLVEGQRQSAASSSYNIRGAGGSNANGDSPVGYYLDDVPFIVTNFGVAPPVRFFDINRVEVLRVSDDLDRPEFTRCVTSAMQGLRFAALDEDISVRVPYTLSPVQR